MIKIEPFDELLAREHLVVAVRPAQAGEIVDDGFGQETVIVILHDGNAPWRFDSLAPSSPRIIDRWA